MKTEITELKCLLETEQISEEQLKLLIEFHKLDCYTQLLEMLQNELIGIITRKDYNALEQLGSDPRRHNLQDIFHLLTQMATTR